MASDVLFVMSSIFNQIDEDFHDETSSSSSSEEDCYQENDDMPTLCAILMVHETRGEISVLEKLSDYVERVVLGYSKTTFKQHFRVFPETFQLVLMLVKPILNGINACGRKQISAEKQLLITLWFMATPDSYRSICVKFGVGKATAWRAVKRVTYALHCLAPRFLKWPRGEEATRVIEEFQRAKNFPGVIGAIDGSFIKIRAPKKDAASYICRKSFHAIHLQAVCDARSLFTHCYTGHILILLEMQLIHFIHMLWYNLEITDILLQGKRISITVYRLLAWPLKKLLGF
ncbi:uncharacterized protein [Anoplolepis gracilipes]|uniref:uncharacterized protein n=1 Tax=Anoplolepis gracilipes TaxID=354296 RepID=UPI003BA03FFD